MFPTYYNISREPSGTIYRNREGRRAVRCGYRTAANFGEFGHLSKSAKDFGTRISTGEGNFIWKREKTVT